jgi:hypothetical protein
VSCLTGLAVLGDVGLVGGLLVILADWPMAWLLYGLACLMAVGLDCLTASVKSLELFLDVLVG